MAEQTILVVDDSVTMRKIIVNTMKKIGYSQFVEAEDGKAALAKMYSENVDLVITDWNMPEMNGLELVNSIRGDASFTYVPIIMLTTRSAKSGVW